MSRNSPQFLAITMFIITLLAISASKNLTRVKDVFVSLRNGSGNVAGASIIETPAPTPTATEASQAQPSPSPSVTVQVTQQSPSPTATTINQSSKTRVVVNGKEITPDTNGNVTYHEENSGSNVDVKVSNSFNQQSSSTIHTQNSVNVNVNQD